MNDFENYMKSQGMQSLARFEKEFEVLILTCKTRRGLVQTHAKLSSAKTSLEEAKRAIWSYHSIERCDDTEEVVERISLKLQNAEILCRACEELFSDDVVRVVSNYFSN